MKNFAFIRCLFSLFFVGLISALPMRADDQVYTKVDEPPVPLKTPPPKYPSDLRRDGVTGAVTVAVVIDEKGLVDSCEISKASNEAFSQPALEAVRQWKFKPGKLAGAAVKTKVILPLRFTIDD